MPALLETRKLTKRFPGVLALHDVDFELLEGEIHSLCGENGAGKSTLIKTLSGIWPHGSYEGELRMDGHEVSFSGIADAEQAGLAVIYQELALVDSMTVAENIFLGDEPTHAGLIDWNRIYQEAAELLKRFKLNIDPAAQVRSLGTGQQQLVEIVKALRKQSRVLILDEPTAALSETEVEVLLDILRDLRSQGVACVYISHKLDEVFAISDRVTILRDGSSVNTRSAKDTRKAEVIHDMVGRPINDQFPRGSSTPGEELLRVEHLSVENEMGDEVLSDLSFTVYMGEVLGIGGLMGAGRSETLMHLFGAWGKRTAGKVFLRGIPFAPENPRKAMASGMALVSEDRKRFGLHLDKPIGFNLSLSSLNRIPGFFLDQGAEAKRNHKMFEQLRVKAGGLETVVGTLSGGNQQKVVIGKALLIDPELVLLDEPTRGIDVGAKLEVYHLIHKLTAAGKAVILVSSELPELMGMSDRIVMLAEGKQGGLFSREEATQERLLSAAIPGHSYAVTEKRT